MNLLASKYFLPGQEINHLCRGQDINLIAPTTYSGVTFVIAPAGFGKSSFVGDWVIESGRANLWLSLDTSEADIYAFARYLLSGLKQSLNLPFETSEHFCQPNIRQDQKQFQIALLNELAEVECDFSIVLDDFYLAESAQLCQFISGFIKNLPTRCRLILISRTAPQLAIAKFKLTQQFTSITSAELRLSAEQILQYLEQSASPVEPSVVDKITNLSQGWMMLVKLMSLNNKLSTKASYKLLEQENVEQYLVEEVLNQLPQNTIEFLYQSASLTNLNAELCDFCLQRTDSSSQLDFLAETGLFLVALDSDKDWYRYHHLFADILSNQRPTSAKQEYDKVHGRAATWLWQQQMTSLALAEAELAEDNELLLSLLEQVWLSTEKEAWLGSNDDYLAAQINKVGTEYSLSYPYLYAIYGLNNISIEPQQSISLLRQIRADLAQKQQLQPKQDAALTICYLAEAYLAAAQHNPSQLQLFGNKVLTILKQKQDKTRQEHAWLGSVSILMAGVNWSAGHMLKAQELMLDSIEHMEKTANASAIISSYFILTHTLYGSGKNKLATKYIKAAMSLLDTLFSPLPQGSAEIYLAAAHAEFERGKIDIAESYLAKAETMSVQSGINEAKHFYPKLKALITFEQGNSNLAATLLLESEQLKTITPFSDATDTHYWQTRFDLIEQNQLVMNNWWHKQPCSISEVPNYREELNYLNWLHWGLIENNYDNHEFNQIAQTLAALIESAKQEHRYRTVIEGQCLAAFVALKQVSNKTAIELLQDAVTISSNNGLMFYLGQLPIIKTIFNDQGLSRELPAKLANYFLPSNGMQATRLVESLSKTELKILQQLQTELSGPEICKLCFISLNTFRTHTKNIYSKLNVNSRMAAVNKGKQLELI